MPVEKALAIVLRTTDWSESSRIATLWTREFGKVRGLAKGGRRLKSSFESALDLLTLCSIVLLRKSSGGLDLLTEAVVVQRFPRLTTHLPALYGGYYVAELLNDGTQEDDPHPRLFDRALATLRELGDANPGQETAVRVSLRVMRFEMQLLEELGYTPVLDRCVGCETALRTERARVTFSVDAGGIVCPACEMGHRDRQTVSATSLRMLRLLAQPGEEWRSEGAAGRGEQGDVELRRVLGQYVTFRLGRRPRMLPYLEGIGKEQREPRT
jgi:DNA repair protein RecO (recombination protein O)